MSVQLHIRRRKTHYIKSSAPTTADGPIEVGTLWSDTTTPALKRCTATSPITFVSVEGGGEGGVEDGDKGDITVSDTGTTWTIDADAVTYAKIQNVSATDKVLGRSTAGAGDIEEIACTSAGRALLDDADAAAQRTTLALGDLATLDTVNNDQWSGTDLAIANGGTGASTATAAFDALAPTTTQGDLLYHNGTDNVRLAAGTSGQVLQTLGGSANPQWAWQPALYLVFGYNSAWTNMPAASTELIGTGGSLRVKADLTTRKQVRMVANIYIAGAAGADLHAEYSTDGSAWSTLTSEVAIDSVGLPHVGAWEAIPVGAQTDVFIRVIGKDGNATADPGIGPTGIEVR